MLPQKTVDAYSVLNSGLDWLTCTAKNSENSLRLERLADEEFDRQRIRKTGKAAERRLGFEGFAGTGIYFGRRSGDVMLQLSGPTSTAIASDAILLASNVSRLDLQVTLFTEGHQVNLASDTWDHLKTVQQGAHRPRSYSLIVNHPEGQTLYLNSRKSDHFGRIYDKGVEGHLGPAGLLWRYEVEFKRSPANQIAAQYARHEQPAAFACGLVHSWMALRGVLPPWELLSDETNFQRESVDPTRDVLTWFKESLSKTVAKAVDQHGLSVVLDNLGLLKHVQVLEVKKDGNS